MFKTLSKEQKLRMTISFVIPILCFVGGILSWISLPIMMGMCLVATLLVADIFTENKNEER